MKKIKKFVAKMLLTIIVATSSLTAMAAESDVVESTNVDTQEVEEITNVDMLEVEDTTDVESTNVDMLELEDTTNVESTNVDMLGAEDTTNAESTNVDMLGAEDTTNAESTNVEPTNMDILEVEDTTNAESTNVDELLNEVDNTNDNNYHYVDLTFIIPSNTVITKDGITLTSYEADVMLSEGELVLSQPTALEYKNRIESDVIVTIANGEVSVTFEENQVNGKVTDSIGNVVSFDGTTLEIINSDKMEDINPEEPDEDEPIKPEDTPADYTIRYFKNSVSDENLLHKDVVAGIEGEAIDLSAISLNAYKPSNTEFLIWEDGVMQDGAATVVLIDDTDVIDVVYVSTNVELPINGNADFLVKYYRDDLQEGNYLGEYLVEGNEGERIDYTSIDVNKFQPASYSTGEIQTVVSATIVTSDDSDIVYILYTRVEKEVQIVTETIEVPIEVEKIVEKVVEVPVETIVEKEVIKEVPVETIVEKEVIKEVPVETIVEVPIEKVVTETVYVPVEKEVVKEITNTIEVEKVVEIPGETEVVYVEVPTTQVVEVEKVVERNVPIYVEIPTETDEDISITPEENPDPELDEDTPITPNDGPQTGDETPFMLLFVIMAIAAFGMIVTRKKNA